MKHFTVLLDDETAERIRQHVGPRGLGPLVRLLLDEWLVTRKEVVPKPKPMAQQLSKADTLEGYVCTEETRTGRCGKPATKWQGNLARCEEH